MNRVLIAVGEREIGEQFQNSMSQEGLQTALVWNPIQMVEFCKQHTPDFILVDLGFSESGLWSALQAVRGIGSLANIPLYGLFMAPDQHVLEQAKAAGFANAFSMQSGAGEAIQAIKTQLPPDGMQAEAATATETVTSRDPSLNRLREIASDVIRVTNGLQGNVSEYGDDGPELFGYIVSSGKDIREKLNTLPDYSLHDKELRHDFRNMIGSVTGFAELILMEPGLSAESSEGLSNLRLWSKEFVDILDVQKEEATV